MRFWDSSAVIHLLVAQPQSSAVRQTYEQDPDIVAWWATATECDSALARLERQGALDAASARVAFGYVDRLVQVWNEIQPSSSLRPLARRLMRTHSLRAADALQLAAAYVAAENRPATLVIVCLDVRLRQAASQEGFELWPT